MTRIVLYHDEWGVFLGYGLGFVFWSKLDSVGQKYAAVFESVEEAKEYVEKWKEAFIEEDYKHIKYNRINEIKYMPVECEADRYASIPEIVNAGLPGWEPEEFE